MEHFRLAFGILMIPDKFDLDFQLNTILLRFLSTHTPFFHVQQQRGSIQKYLVTIKQLRQMMHKKRKLHETHITYTHIRHSALSLCVFVCGPWICAFQLNQPLEIVCVYTHHAPIPNPKPQTPF